MCDYIERDFKLHREEKVAWKGADGVTVEGLLYHPGRLSGGKTLSPGRADAWWTQASDKFGVGGSQNYVPVLTAMGYAVLQPNYRGSTSYGDDFLRDMVGHYFKNAHLDVLAGFDSLVASGIADPDRLVKMGWSGGGHMTNKIITVTASRRPYQRLLGKLAAKGRLESKDADYISGRADRRARPSAAIGRDVPRLEKQRSCDPSVCCS